MEPIHVVVDRERWYRGRGPDSSRLLLLDGTMCCVGFLCRTMKIPEDAIRNVAAISEMHNASKFPDGWLLQTKHTPFGLSESSSFGQLYTINDSTKMGDAEREALLIAHAEPLGIQFE